MSVTDRSTLAEKRQALLAKRLRGEVLPSPSQPLTRRQEGGPAPLSWGQQQIWFLSQLAAGSNVYNEAVTIHCPPSISVDALEMAFNEVLRRHEAWRTVIGLRDGSPVQVVQPPQYHRLPVVDLSRLPQSERGKQATRLAEEDARRLFDLERGPLWRATLTNLGPDGYRLQLTLRHIIFDGVSVYRVLLPELIALHEAIRAGRPSPLPELPAQYSDYAEWQRAWVAGLQAESQIDYWRERLAGAPTLQLPTDRPRPPEQGFRGAFHRIALPRTLIDRLARTGSLAGATLFMTALAAFQVLLFRYSRQEDLVMGTVSSGRKHRDLEGMLGYFLNPIVLRTDLSGDPSFLQLLERVSSRWRR